MPQNRDTVGVSGERTGAIPDLQIEHNTDQPKERIHEFIAKRGGGVSFIEIEREFGKGCYELSAGTNLVYWQGLTSETCDGILKLLSEKRILMYPTSPLIYLVDGGALRLPIAKRPPKDGYKEPHWLAVVLWTIEQIKSGAGGEPTVSPQKAAIYRKAGYDI